MVRMQDKNPTSASTSEVTYFCREATKADVAAIMGIERACFPRNRWTRSDFCAYLGSAYANLWVAVDKTLNDIVGFLAFTSENGRITIQSIAVDPSFWHNKVATCLLTLLKRIAAQTDCRSVSAVVPERNVPTQLLLRSLGFVCFEHEPVRITRTEYQDGYNFIWRCEWIAAELEDAKLVQVKMGTAGANNEFVAAPEPSPEPSTHEPPTSEPPTTEPPIEAELAKPSSGVNGVNGVNVNDVYFSFFATPSRWPGRP